MQVAGGDGGASMRLERQELTFPTVLEDAEGRFVAGKERVMDLRVTVRTCL